MPEIFINPKKKPKRMLERRKTIREIKHEKFQEIIGRTGTGKQK